MYANINANVSLVLKNIPPNAVVDYSWLVSNLQRLDVAVDSGYQSRYITFWKMRFPSSDYLDAYFRLLENNKRNPQLDPNMICTSLQQFSQKKLQFSFATKMAHMENPQNPIYDSLVSQFYFLPNAKSKASYALKLANHMRGYDFLVAEYRRIIANSLLATAIVAFRGHFPASTTQTDEKVIDWLIWSYISLANGGAFRDGVLHHS